MTKIYTIGFTQIKAQQFFGLLKTNNVQKLVDVRLNNISQLAGFAKRADLEYFLKEICQTTYVHAPELAPTKEILDPYKKGKGTWEAYEGNFMNLMEKRCIEKQFEKDFFENSCLLCSERTPHHCHRRLVVEYLNAKWGEVLKVEHLGGE